MYPRQRECPTIAFQHFSLLLGYLEIINIKKNRLALSKGTEGNHILQGVVRDVSDCGLEWQVRVHCHLFSCLWVPNVYYPILTPRKEQSPARRQGAMDLLTVICCTHKFPGCQYPQVHNPQSTVFGVD